VFANLTQAILNSTTSASLYNATSFRVAVPTPTVTATTYNTSEGCHFILRTTHLMWANAIGDFPTATTTITAATQIIFIDPKSNRTSTSLIQNVEVDVTTVPLETNAAGTRITSLTFWDRAAKTNMTTVM
jgi:hypothetical protein